MNQEPILKGQMALPQPVKIGKILLKKRVKLENYAIAIWIDLNWWKEVCSEEELDILEQGSKLTLLLSVIADCRAKSEKLLVFSQSLFSLHVIKHYLATISKNTEYPDPSAKLGSFTGKWKLDEDFFYLDGSTDIAKRAAECNKFKDTSNKQAM